MQEIKTETGFDVICSSCLQYKNKVYCKSVNILSNEKKKKFIVEYCSLLKNRSNAQYVCNLCLKDIRLDKYPKRSNKMKFKYANFPNFLLKQLEKFCMKEKSDAEDVNCFLLNRLESYLLKLIIPFIRIARCGRGTYLKVIGDLILITADVSHSMYRVLPLQQELIPVRFKRKLSYHGSYIEEFIDRKKVEIFFSWFKCFNHLYKDIKFDSALVEDFLD